MINSLVYNKSLIFNDPENADFKISVGDHTFHCHGTVLYTECRKLYNLCRISEDGKFTAMLENVDPVPFLELLKFIYLGQCDNHVNCFSSLEKLAVEYELPKLTMFLMVEISKPSIENAAEILQATIETERSTFWNGLYISDNFMDVLNSDSFLRIEKTTLMEILKLDLVCGKFSGETDVFNAVLKYVNFRLKGVTTDRRTYLGDDLIRLIRFPTMTKSEFEKCMERDPTILCESVRDNIFEELKGGPPNIYGFSNVKRIQEPVGFRIQEYRFAFKYNSRLSFGCIPTNRTVFMFNATLAFTSVWMYRLLKKSVDIKVRLLNQHGQVITSGEVKGAKSYYRSCSYQHIKMSPIIELIPKKRYILETEYLERGEVEFYQHDVADNLMHTIKMKQNDYTKVEFTELNKMLVALIM